MKKRLSDSPFKQNS